SQQTLAGTIASKLSWVHPTAQQPIVFPWVRAIREEAPQVEQLLKYRLSDGAERIFSTNSAPIIATDGKQRGTLATFRDVTHIEEHRAELEEMLTVLRSSRDEIKRKNRELEILATQDALTGCLNRRAFFERFDHYWDAAKKQNKPLACLMIDNDHFKLVNDTYGHQVGDDVLRAVAALLRKEFSEMGLVCRFGGEEFCVILPDHDARMARRLAEHVRKKIEVLRVESLPELRVSASLGVSDLSYEAKDPQDLLNQADMCLYVAKHQGRNRVIVFQPQFASMPTGAAETMEASLPDANHPAQPQSAETVQSIPFQAVTALVSALAYRDAETAEHSRRVADLCVATAKGLLDQNHTHILEIAALLHDIGKIGVPDDILLKPDKLTNEEWHLMAQQHHIGIEIVAETFNSDELSEIMRTYHAFYGGHAKKKHLPVGEEIPYGGR
ncbi:MAG: diguanylate cyclase, partial [Candidatus Paceibacterota bacterium]